MFHMELINVIAYPVLTVAQAFGVHWLLGYTSVFLVGCPGGGCPGSSLQDWNWSHCVSKMIIIPWRRRFFAKLEIIFANFTIHSRVIKDIVVYDQILIFDG